MITLTAIYLSLHPKPYVEHGYELEEGRILFSKEKHNLKFYVQDNTNSFWCNTWVKEIRNAWGHNLNDLALQMPEHPQSDFGWALQGVNGLSGSSAVGYCNANLTTHSGFAQLTFTHNHSCLPIYPSIFPRITSNCLTDSVTLTLTQDQLRIVAQEFDLSNW